MLLAYTHICKHGLQHSQGGFILALVYSILSSSSILNEQVKKIKEKIFF